VNGRKAQPEAKNRAEDSRSGYRNVQDRTHYDYDCAGEGCPMIQYRRFRLS